MLNSKPICRVALIAALAASPWFAPCAHAELGGAPVAFASGNIANVQTVQRSLLKAGAAATSNASTSAGSATYTVRETTLGTGTVVREYVASNGQVFGVAWQGPIQPSYAALLGAANSRAFTSHVAAMRATGGVRAPVNEDDPNLVVHVSGHMRSYFGQAWLPQALPAGVTGADIR